MLVKGALFYGASLGILSCIQQLSSKMHVSLQYLILTRIVDYVRALPQHD